MEAYYCLITRLEDQAFDRAHRLGQQLDVNIYKLTIAMTVEDRILAVSLYEPVIADSSAAEPKARAGRGRSFGHGRQVAQVDHARHHGWVRGRWVC